MRDWQYLLQQDVCVVLSGPVFSPLVHHHVLDVPQYLREGQVLIVTLCTKITHSMKYQGALHLIRRNITHLC